MKKGLKNAKFRSISQILTRNEEFAKKKLRGRFGERERRFIRRDLVVEKGKIRKDCKIKLEKPLRISKVVQERRL